MRYTKFALAALAVSTAFIWSCQSDSSDSKKADEALVKASATKEEMIKRGQFLVNIGGCNDCHSPKIMTPQGPMIDSSRMLSGHPSTEPMPAVIGSALKPGNWILMGPDATAFVGPWGVSYTANLTSDSATGLGAWTEGQFIQTMRTGKHLGMETGRPIMPPMPWPAIGQLPDEDLKSILAYLQSLPAISNHVHAPLPPDKAIQP